MIPAVMQSFGGQLYFIRGGRLIPVNMLLQTVPDTEPVGEENNPGPHQQPNLGATEAPWIRKFFGGFNTFYPTSYANHKPLSVFKGKAYQALNRINNSSFGLLYINRYDGSGIFINEGNSSYESKKYSNGRGTEFLSPSGTSFGTKSNDLGLLSYNGNLFIVGQIWDKENSSTNSWSNNGWTYEAETFPPDQSDRRYASIVIDTNEKKIFGPTTQFTPDSPSDEYTHTTDVIGFQDDIYFANWIDVIKVAGGSGSMSLIDSDLKSATSRSFATFPQSGYIDGVPKGETWLLLQTGSGVISKINTTKTDPSGLSQIVDLGSIASTVRPNDNFQTRLNSSSNEPGRSNLLINFNNKLNSFFVSEVSGYQHFSCSLSPSGTGNWSDVSSSLPFDLGAYDSNIFGFVDSFRNRMYLAQVTMGEVGVVGHAGVANGAGGLYVYEFDSNENWREIFRGVPGFTPRGLIPLQNLGPFVSIPSGANPSLVKCSDYAIIDYKLHDLFNRTVDVDVEYSIDFGASWNSARRFKTYDTATLLGSGTTSLATNLDGIDYNFYWHYVNDIGFNNLKTPLLRIRPRLSR